MSGDPRVPSVWQPFLPLPALAWRLVAVAYVIVDGALGAISFSSDRARPPVEWAAFVLLLPTLFVTIRVIYVGGAVAWHIRDSMPGHPMWPVTVIFTGLFVAAALVNVLFVWVLVSADRRRRHDGLRWWTRPDQSSDTSRLRT